MKKDIDEIKEIMAVLASDSKDSGLPQMASEGIHAGFPSPAQDYMSGVIDLNRELVRHPEATFYGRVVGDSMRDAGVEEGDVLVIDKALEPQEGDMVVCCLDGEFALKRISFTGKEAAGAKKAARQRVSYNILNRRDIWLLPANPQYKPIHVEEGNDFTIWGTVTYVIKKVK